MKRESCVSEQPKSLSRNFPPFAAKSDHKKKKNLSSLAQFISQFIFCLVLSIILCKLVLNKRRSRTDDDDDDDEQRQRFEQQPPSRQTTTTTTTAKWCHHHEEKEM
jgi:flagellar biosynthesis/type III secretory pathway M-ring protein FliF/YscJ